MLRRVHHDVRGDRPPAVRRYLTDMRRELRGPAGAKVDILNELGDGLDDAVEAYLDSGLDREAAGRRAVADFGEVAEIAPQLQRELNFAQGRRTAWLLSFLIVIQALIAQFIWTNEPVAAPPRFSPGEGYMLLAHMLDAFQYVTVIVGALAIAAFSWLGRRVPVRPGMVWGVGLFAIVALVAKTVMALLLVALVPGMFQQTLSLMGAVQQLLVWIIPTCYVLGSAWRCLRIVPMPSPLRAR
ncbi:permease prefix domain 1-containing protein [Thermomonospora amylolytica]|uniref:permease prefix domain 1-containing protein n=1 Tax=Thermomonospora amylolytica TaxID=1411117 RepID=UPI000E6CD364|nr:permease prefix domain 1-containing protein [Thermomonospora amylolytica]